ARSTRSDRRARTSGRPCASSRGLLWRPSELQPPLAGGRLAADRVDGQVLARPAAELLDFLPFHLAGRPDRAGPRRHVRGRQLPRTVAEGVEQGTLHSGLDLGTGEPVRGGRQLAEVEGGR